MSKLDGRTLYVPLGRDAAEDLNILSDCIGQSDAELIDDPDKGPVWVNEGKLVGLGRDTLLAIIAKYIAVRRLTNTGTADEPVYACDYVTPQIDDKAVRALLGTVDGQSIRSQLANRSMEEAGLGLRIARGPNEPRRLSPQHRREIQDRLKSGEPKDRIARDYGVDAAVIRRPAG